MLIERPPRFFRALVPGGLFNMSVAPGNKEVYLTFDDGPIPEATPWVLDTLEWHRVKATFFMVGDNARRYPHLVREVAARGHRIGNHTMHHLQGIKVSTSSYLQDVEQAQQYLSEAALSLKHSGGDKPLFRPPHGWLKPSQAKALASRYKIVMYDLVTRDYSRRLDADAVLSNVKRYTRPGAIIVFHDSLKSIDKLKVMLPQALEWLRRQGYNFSLL